VHSQGERGHGRKLPDIADARLLAAVTSAALGTVASPG
jgi:hypothetical protein